MSKRSIDLRNYGLDGEAPRFNNGYSRWYDGTRPANANTALSGNTLLVELRYGSPAYAAAVGAVATANALTAGTAVAAGTPTFVRDYHSDGTTVLEDKSIGRTVLVGGSGTEEVLYDKATAALVVGDVVQCSSCTRTAPIGS